jgi:hypothetical protein
MKDDYRATVAAFFCFLCLLTADLPIASAADNALVIAANFAPEGKVLELDVPPEVDGMRFVIAVENGQSRSINLVVAREGRHCYEVRHLDQWHGTVKYVAITPLPGVTGRIKEPTVADNIDMFLEPERITPSTVNLLIPHRIFAWSWTTCLLLVCLLSAGLFASKKKQLIPGLVVGFLVAWGLMDLRIMFDHAMIVYHDERFHRGMEPLTTMKVFAEKASTIIERQTWSHGPFEGEKFLEYCLAEHPYAASRSAASPAFRITDDSAEGPVLLHHDKYYLVRKEKP